MGKFGHFFQEICWLAQAQTLNLIKNGRRKAAEKHTFSTEIVGSDTRLGSVWTPVIFEKHVICHRQSVKALIHALFFFCSYFFLRLLRPRKWSKNNWNKFMTTKVPMEEKITISAALRPGSCQMHWIWSKLQRHCQRFCFTLECCLGTLSCGTCGRKWLYKRKVFLAWPKPQ